MITTCTNRDSVLSVLTAVALLASSGCVGFDRDDSARDRLAFEDQGLTPEPTRYIDPAAQTSWLGRGVQSKSGLHKQACVTGDPVIYNNRKLHLGYRYAATAEQSLREVTGRVSASVNLGLFGGGVSVSMYTRLQESENTLNVVYRVSYKGKSLSLENRTLTALGQSVVGQSAQEIEEACGDQYIDHIQLGNEIYFVARMTFASQEEYKKFVTKIKVRVLFFTSTSTITDEFFEAAQNGRYSIEVLSPNPLPQAIVNQLGSDGQRHCATSSASALTPCVDAGNSIMAYLQSRTGYPAWLQDDNNLGVSWFSSSNYEMTGHPEFAGVPSQMFSELRDQHQQLLDRIMAQEELQNRLRPFAEVQSPDQSQYIDLLQDVKDNLVVLDQAMATCADTLDVDDCQSAIDDADDRLVAIPL